MISICITVKNRSRVRVGDRELLLFPNCVKSIAEATIGLDDVELVVSDWHSDDWPLDQWLREATQLAVQIVQLEGSFSRGRGLNEAARKARGDILFFTDADCLLCPLVIQNGREHMRTGTTFFPVLYSFDGPDHHGGWWRHEGFGNALVTRLVYEQAGQWPEYTTWGKEDDHFFESVSAIAPVVRAEVPGFYHQWHPEDILWKDRYGDRDPEELKEILEARIATRELTELVPAGESLILVDEARFGISEIEGRRAYPFLEKNGEYAGPPPDDATAIGELKRMQAAGATFIAFAWTAFWWLEFYEGLSTYICTQFRPVLQNERLRVFDMRLRIGNLNDNR